MIETIGIKVAPMWILRLSQNLEKDFIPILMYTTVDLDLATECASKLKMRYICRFYIMHISLKKLHNHFENQQILSWSDSL